jgi:hypothetical protein
LDKSVVIYGAIGNAARGFTKYFRPGRKIEELKFLAAHIVLMACHYDNLMIGGLDVACFNAEGFELAGEAEKEILRRQSEALDTAIWTHLYHAKQPA